MKYCRPNDRCKKQQSKYLHVLISTTLKIKNTISYQPQLLSSVVSNSTSSTYDGFFSLLDSADYNFSNNTKLEMATKSGSASLHSIQGCRVVGCAYKLSIKYGCPSRSSRFVRTSHPLSVTNRVCSNWADSRPSCVTDVQLSGHV